MPIEYRLYVLTMILAIVFGVCREVCRRRDARRLEEQLAELGGAGESGLKSYSRDEIREIFRHCKFLAEDILAEAKVEGGRKRAENLSAERRREIARHAANIRWGNEQKDPSPA